MIWSTIVTFTKEKELCYYNIYHVDILDNIIKWFSLISKCWHNWLNHIKTLCAYLYDFALSLYYYTKIWHSIYFLSLGYCTKTWHVSCTTCGIIVFSGTIPCLSFHQCQVLYHVCHWAQGLYRGPMCVKPHLAHILVAIWPHVCQASFLAYNPYLLYCWPPFINIVDSFHLRHAWPISCATIITHGLYRIHGITLMHVC